MSNNVRRGLAATVVVKKDGKQTKYSIENDGIINIETTSGAVFKEVRCTGTSQDGSCLRFIGNDEETKGPNEVPMHLIAKIEDAKKKDYPVVTVK